jgi:hypothetical protein
MYTDIDLEQVINEALFGTGPIDPNQRNAISAAMQRVKLKLWQNGYEAGRHEVQSLKEENAALRAYIHSYPNPII